MNRLTPTCSEDYRCSTSRVEDLGKRGICRGSAIDAGLKIVDRCPKSVLWAGAIYCDLDSSTPHPLLAALFKVPEKQWMLSMPRPFTWGTEWVIPPPSPKENRLSLLSPCPEGMVGGRLGRFVSGSISGSMSNLPIRAPSPRKIGGSLQKLLEYAVAGRIFSLSSESSPKALVDLRVWMLISVMGRRTGLEPALREYQSLALPIELSPPSCSLTAPKSPLRYQRRGDLGATFVR